MEMINGIHDFVLVVALVAIVMVPRAIQTYRAFRQ
jgi:hypothetical protein